MDADTQRKMDEKFLRDKFIRSIQPVRSAQMAEMIPSHLASLAGHIAAALIANPATLLGNQNWDFTQMNGHTGKLATTTRILCDAIAEEMEKSKLFAPAVVFHPPQEMDSPSK